MLALLVFVAAPKYFTPMFAPSGPDELVAGGFVGLLVGYVWLLRLFFTNLDPDSPHWRYRAPPD